MSMKSANTLNRIQKLAAGALSLAILLTMAAAAGAYAAEPETIRVGYFAFPGYHEVIQGENGPQGSGYGFDFLQMLRRYTNLNYQYVGYEDSWLDMQQMLRDGRIDLVTSARKTSQREKEFAFSSPIGTSYAELCVRADDSRFLLNDYASFDGMLIGTLKANSRNDDLAELAREKGFSYRVVAYDEEAELTGALHDGEVDGIVASSLRKHTGEKIVARFALEEFYAIVRKEDTRLLEEINRGIEQMDLCEGDWRNKLYYKYTTSSSESALSFTGEEQAYIRAVQSGEKVITACAQPDRDPYSYVEDGRLTGIIPEYFDHLMGMAGLPYSVVTAKNRQQYYEWAAANAVDVYMDMSTERSALLEEGSGISTDSYIQLTMSRVTKKDFQGEIHTVAVAYNQSYDGIDIDLAENVQAIPYETRGEAMQAVRDGKADACYVYTYMAEKFVNQDPDSELIFHIVNKPAFSLSISIRPETDHELISILNKCLKADQSHFMDELVEKYTHYEQEDVTLARFARKNPWLLAAVVSAMMCAVAVIVLQLRNNRRIRSIARERTVLAARLEEKNRLLEESVQQAQNANMAKTTFLNNMSHDIRTPMNAIIGFTSLAATHLDDKKLLEDYLQKIMTSSSHLLALINDVLDMSRIESGRIRIEEKECRLTEVMDELRSILQADVSAKRLNFVMDTGAVADEHVVCDRLRLNQVLLNCMSNAIKFTMPGGTVGIRVTQEGSAAQDGFAQYVFVVSDNGIGMSEEFARHIFEPFTREESSTVSGIPGTGLGMAITKNIVELMGGSISVRSAKGSGTEFTIAFRFRVVKAPCEAAAGKKPDAPRALPEEEGAQAGAARFKGSRVLLVEDNDLNREIASAILAELHIRAEEAENGRVAVEMVRSAAPGYYGMVLMDIQMPVMDGYEATRRIRSMDRPDAAALPIVAVSANAFEEDMAKSREAGMNEHIAKPFNREKLEEVLDRYLSAKNG